MEGEALKLSLGVIAILSIANTPFNKTERSYGISWFRMTLKKAPVEAM